MSRYYPTSYYSLERLKTSPKSSGLRQWARLRRDEFAVIQRGLLGRVLDRISPNVGLKEVVAEHYPGGGVTLANLSVRSRILDVGCGSGRFLLKLHGAGFRSLQGVDLYVEKNIEYPEGLRILKGSIGTCEGEWDVIMFHHSFEHLPDPLETLTTATRLLARDGTMVVRIPLVSSYAWEKYGVAWVQLDAPRHFFLHSRESMGRLAGAAGLRVERVVDDSTEFQFLGSELYVRDIPLVSEGVYVLDAKGSIFGSVFSREEVQQFRRLAGELRASGRGDQAAFYLKKT